MVISPCIFNIIWPEKDQSWGGTSHWSSELIFIYLESVQAAILVLASAFRLIPCLIPFVQFLNAGAQIQVVILCKSSC